MSVVKSLLAAVVSFYGLSLVTAEIWHLHNMFADGDVPYFQNEQGQRFMQLETGFRDDINTTTNACLTTGSELICNVNSIISGSGATLTNMAVTVRCALDSQNAFDFRTASNCGCGVELTDENGQPKDGCYCNVCPDGFGDSPVSLDCEEANEYVIETCSSIDCDFACNGTCALDCANAGPECRFCEDNPFAPTVAPTGIDDRDGPGRPTLISAAPPTTTTTTATMWIMSTILLGTVSTFYVIA